MAAKFELLLLNIYYVISLVILLLSIQINCNEDTITRHQLRDIEGTQLIDEIDLRQITADTQSDTRPVQINDHDKSTTTTTDQPAIEQTTSLKDFVPTNPEETAEDSDGAAKTTSAPEKQEMKCTDENYCLNGGTCVIKDGGMFCFCPESFYGARCQTRNVCKTTIANSLTGDQICSKIERECFRTDKYFRCICHEDEYFVFKTNQFHTDNAPWNNLALDNYRTSDSTAHSNNFSAECHKIDKCLGVRCRQMSEICKEGKCVCNQNSGYLKDPIDGLCKLLDPCSIAISNEKSICGQAKCVATYDRESYKCICPIGYKAVTTSESKSSTQCLLLNDDICNIPLLNNCQHLCNVNKKSNNYSCSCLPGYKAGTRIGIDDNLCFFNEKLNSNYHHGQGRDLSLSLNENSQSTEEKYTYTKYYIQKESCRNPTPTIIKDRIFTYDPLTSSNPGDSPTDNQINIFQDISESHISSTKEFYIKREHQYDNSDTNRMSAQDRCNRHCEENKICVLEKGSIDSYRCVCDRQGYVSVADKCLDWCSAAEFSTRVLDSLQSVCWSGLCKASGLKPSSSEHQIMENENAKLERESSWRPIFECDCSTSPLIQDSKTKLCKLDFKAILKPCLPGNEGFIDCVENKNAYCAVLYKPFWSFVTDLQNEQLRNHYTNTGSSFKNMKTTYDRISNRNSSNKSKIKAKDKLYTCVCSPEKKFLIDKPRNKARCVDECDLLNTECGRWNRMCRESTIEPDDLGLDLDNNDRGPRNLVNTDSGVRMDFKRTGCECLPGFNVGPTESADFILDDNNPSNKALSTDPSNVNSYPKSKDIINNNNDNSDEKSEYQKTKYMNINSSCLLDYDVVEFHVRFKAPADFDPTWIKIRNLSLIETSKLNLPSNQQPNRNSSSNNKNDKHQDMVVQSNDESKPSSNDNSQSKSEKVEDTKDITTCDCTSGNCILSVPGFMSSDISEFHKNAVFVGECYLYLAPLSIEAYQECIKYRYWILQKLRNHFVDWRGVMTSYLNETFALMEGNIRVRVNKCEATIRAISTTKSDKHNTGDHKNGRDSTQTSESELLRPMDQHPFIDADIDCELTLHSASDGHSPRYSRKVLLEKQLQKFIFDEQAKQFGNDYYLMAPKLLIRRESVDQLAEHRKLFNPCKSTYAYCDKQTKCDMVDMVNFTCTCEYGYTPISSRDIYHADSRKEVCEDINECLFDVCKELANVSTCINEIGDYRCQCNRHYTGDNKRYCTHLCNTIQCKHGKCRLVDDHHAFCECDEGYKENDCSVQDPNVALRKANMIICGSIFTSVLLLTTTLAISLNSQLKKTKKKLKRLEAANETARLFEFTTHQPFRPRMSKVSSGS